MKNTNELERDIVNITLKIHSEFPGIFKYIEEIPENISGKNSNQTGTKKLKEYYKSLKEVVLQHAKTNEVKNKMNDPESSKSEGYPPYPPSDDIYNQEQKERDFKPEDISNAKRPNDNGRSTHDEDFDEDISIYDMEVPGSSLDDQQESVGSEDEENNYYSLGGDNHNDLEENED